jgi:hypothetical protein
MFTSAILLERGGKQVSQGMRKYNAQEVRLMMALPCDPSMSIEEYLQLDRSSIETRCDFPSS